jgi:hypothetical protein
MSFKNFFNLRENQNFLFNLIFCLALLQNFDFSTKNLIAIIFSIIIFYNYKNINLKNKALLPLFILTAYLIFISLFNSTNLSAYLTDVRFWFTFLFVILIYKLLNLNFFLNIFIFRFFFLSLLIEFLVFNYLSSYNDILITQNSFNQWFGFFRVVGFARNSSVSGIIFVCLFIYFYQYKVIKPIDWILLIFGLIMLFSSSAFLLITIFFIYFLLKKVKNKITILKRLIVLFFLTLVIYNMPLKQHSSPDSLKIINYQKISKSYYLDNAMYKFNLFLCYVFQKQPMFNYNFLDHSLKKSNTCFVNVKLNPIFGTSISGEIIRGGDMGWLYFYRNFGIVGLFMIIFTLSFYKKNNQFFLILLVLFGSFHYFTLATIFSVFFLATLLNERKLKKE